MFWSDPPSPSSPNVGEEYIVKTGDDEIAIAQKRVKRKQLAQMDDNATIKEFQVYASAPLALKF